MPWKHAVRDLLIACATLAVWQADAALRGGAGALALAVAVAAGGMTALCGFLVHEWGHYLGARSSRSDVSLPGSPFSVFLFYFDPDTNRPPQFLAMSCGGFLASGAVVAGLPWALPLDALSGRIALGLVALGVVATLVLEVPPFVRVLRGGAIPRGAASPPPRDPAAV